MNNKHNDFLKLFKLYMFNCKQCRIVYKRCQYETIESTSFFKSLMGYREIYCELCNSILKSRKIIKTIVRNGIYI